MSGTLYGIGVGIGDPDMMTMKAVKCIRSSDYICLPRENKDECRAYLIARAAVPEIEEKEIIGFDFEMIRDAEVLRKKHHEIYETVKPYLENGKVVSFLTIGDPTVYSTFSYIAEQAKKDGANIRIINGITSFCAFAARLGIALCEGGEELHVVSEKESLDDALMLPGTKVIMKCNRDMCRIRELLKSYAEECLKNGKKVEIYAVENCGMENEKLFFGLEELPDDVAYMTTIIIKV